MRRRIQLRLSTLGRAWHRIILRLTILLLLVIPIPLLRRGRERLRRWRISLLRRRRIWVSRRGIFLLLLMWRIRCVLRHLVSLSLLLCLVLYLYLFLALRCVGYGYGTRAGFVPCHYGVDEGCYEEEPGKEKESVGKSSEVQYTSYTLCKYMYCIGLEGENLHNQRR